MMAGTEDVHNTLNAAIQMVNNMNSKLDLNGTQSPSQISPGSAKTSSASASVDSIATAAAAAGTDEQRMVTERKRSNASAQRSQDKSSESDGSHPHSPHPGVSAVLQQLEQLIICDDWIRKSSQPNNDTYSLTSTPSPTGITKNRSHPEGPRLSELGRTLVTSSSLKAYIDLLGAQHRQSIAAWLYGNTSQTLSNLFRFPSGNLFCSDVESPMTSPLKSGIGYAVRLALRSRYGVERLAQGWKAFVEMGAPVVYVSPALHLDLSSYLATEFAISDVVQLTKLDNELSDIEGRIDIAAFEKQLDADLEAGKLPLLVVGVVGSPILGQNDVISRLLELRKTKTPFWIHVVGQAIAGLCLKEPNKMLIDVLSQVDSLTLPLAVWLGIPAAPVITLYRSVESHKPTYREKLDALPWWVATQHLTPKRITLHIENAYFLSKAMLKGLSAFSEIEILGIENPAEFANRVYKKQYFPLNVLIFKYRYDELERLKKKRKVSTKSLASSNGSVKNGGDDEAQSDSAQESKDVDPLEIEYEEAMEYADSLNCWLGQGLITECRQLGLQMVELRGGYGTAFRYCPLESAATNSTRVEHIQKFVGQLETMLNIVGSTVSARKNFEHLRSQYPSLGIFPVKKWAGVGAVCYIPSIVKDTNPREWNEKQKQQVSHLNIELVHSLRAIDSAFSSGECTEFGVSCVKFGMLSDEKDLNDLVHLVAERGKEIEQSQQYMDSLAEMIRQGIEAANEDLKRENDARIMQEGVMRQIPLMSSLVNWFSPLDKETQNIKGRSFDLKTGQIHSTDIYYKRRLMASEPNITAQEPHHSRTAIEASTVVDSNGNGNGNGSGNDKAAMGDSLEAPHLRPQKLLAEGQGQESGQQGDGIAAAAAAENGDGDGGKHIEEGNVAA